ncbi:peroxisomal biogenesis factor 3 [Cephus cinctus]|uniref:Peroxisomal biogenesis factor 3 n=1 Tax=Cephus cinctus TaxID=211228 RepID=A0AAJ7W347_CEPCN|nr:peroxisomal biogenesis factor 3 [Cephus cinctus]
MFSRLRDFLNRHKRKFIVSGIVIGSLVFLTRYTQRKLREWQEKEVNDLLERSRRRQHFESTERTCNQTILSLATALRESVIKALDTDAVINKLRSGCQDKVETWNTLKVLAISRSATIIYAYAMLVTSLRIQLNLVGGYMFKNSKNQNTVAPMSGPSLEKYLTLCEYFMDEGVEKLGSLIQQKVKQITDATSLTDQLALRDLEQIYWAIVSSISADNSRDPVKNLSTYMLSTNCENEADDTLSRIIKETLDLMESEEVQTLMRTIIRSGFVLVMDHISEYFTCTPPVTNGVKPAEKNTPLPGSSKESETFWADSVEQPINSFDMDGFLNLNKITMPVAKIIPIINGQVPDISTQGDVPSDWLQRLILNEKLKALGANIYEAFSF